MRAIEKDSLNPLVSMCIHEYSQTYTLDKHTLCRDTTNTTVERHSRDTRNTTDETGVRGDVRF